MFANVLEELKGYLGREFLLAAYFPVLIFLSASLALGLEITQNLTPIIEAWDKSSILAQTLSVLGLLTVAAVLAYLFQNFQYSITRFFEGYWSQPPMKWLRRPRETLYLRRWTALDERRKNAEATGDVVTANAILSEQLTFYPPPGHQDKIMPTKLGNIFRAAEIYAYQRYNIDSAIAWTRLVPLLKPESLSGLQGSKTALDFMLLLSILGVTFSVIWCPLLTFCTKRLDLFLLSALGWPLAWLCYQNAVEIAIAYGEQIKATFDLNRRELLKALDRPTPSDLDEERKEWLRLSRFFYRNVPIPTAPASVEKSKGWDRIVDALANFIERIFPPKPNK